MTGDMYTRPSREEIAARVNGLTPPARQPAQPQGDPLAWFAAHVRAGLASRGWTREQLAEKVHDSTGNISNALNARQCPMALAGRIAGAFGVPLAEMVVPYTCRTCAGYGGAPPKGCACLECGAETRAS